MQNGLELQRKLRDTKGLAASLCLGCLGCLRVRLRYALGNLKRLQGDFSSAETSLQESLDLLKGSDQAVAWKMERLMFVLGK